MTTEERQELAATERYHSLIREQAAKYGLSHTQLNAICIVSAGHPLNRLSPDHARFVLAAILAKGEHVQEWAKELERSL